MRLKELWRTVEQLTGQVRWDTGALGRTLAEHCRVNVPPIYEVLHSGLAGQIAVIADELAREGREHEYPEVMALATVLLVEPVLNMYNQEVWPDGVRRAREAAMSFRSAR